MKKLFVLVIGCITALMTFGQTPVVFSGKISEKVEFVFATSSVRIIESFDPPKPYRMTLKPGVIIFTFRGKETTYRGIREAYKHENGSNIFLVCEHPDAPMWMLMITKDGDKIWAQVDASMDVLKGYYLR